MKVKYRVLDYGCEIKKVEIDRENEKSIWIKGSRFRKLPYCNYWNSFKEAKYYLLKIAEDKVKNEEFQLECAKSFLLKVMAQDRACE